MRLTEVLLPPCVLLALWSVIPAAAAAERAGGDQAVPTTDGGVPLFFRENWSIPAQTHEGVFGPKYVSNRMLLLTLYGSPGATNPGRAAAEGMQVERSSPGDGGHIFTGFCPQPCAMTLRDKANLVDLSGLGKIRWQVKASGLHQVHPLIKLADGTWLLGEHGDGDDSDFHPYEFTLSATRWISIDINNLATHGRWMENVDLGKVDEIGFADMMPGSGHHLGGFSAVASIEVYGKTVPRGAASPRPATPARVK